MATKSYEIKFKLFNAKGEQVNGIFTKNQLATKALHDEQLAARHLSWMARNLGLRFELISSVASTTEATRLKPLRLVVETSKQIRQRKDRERRAAKKAGAVVVAA